MGALASAISRGVENISVMDSLSVSFNRPANATAYSTGQLIGTGAASAFEILTPYPNLISTLGLFTNGTALDFDAFLFWGRPSFVGSIDQAAFAPTAADAA